MSERIIELEEFKITNSIFKVVEGNKYDKIFQLNEAKVLNWSRSVKVHFNILINLGLSSGIRFEKIENGEINPRKNEELSSYEINTRILKLDGYYNNIIYRYYLLKNYSSSYDLTVELNELINKLPTTKGLQAAMKDIYDPLYHLRLIYFLHICKDPNDINNFILNKISETLLNILTIMKNSKFSVFADKLVKYFTTEIVEKEKLFSKPDPFKYKIDKRD